MTGIKGKISGFIPRVLSAELAAARARINPLVTILATRQDSLLNFTETIPCVRVKYPIVRFTSGPSSISLGMPHRKSHQRAGSVAAVCA